MHTQTQTHMHTNAHIEYIHKHTHIYTQMHTLNAYTNTNTYAHKCTHWIHTQTHTYIHTNAHVEYLARQLQNKLLLLSMALAEILTSQLTIKFTIKNGYKADFFRISTCTASSVSCSRTSKRCALILKVAMRPSKYSLSLSVFCAFCVSWSLQTLNQLPTKTKISRGAYREPSNARHPSKHSLSLSAFCVLLSPHTLNQLQTKTKRSRGAYRDLRNVLL